MVAVCAVSMILFSGWGFLIHRSVNQLAVYQLPKAMRPFFYTQMDYLVTHSVRPDKRRNVDKSEAPKHFIDAEMYGDSSLWKMPYNWDAAVAKYSVDSLKEYGYVPYWIMEMKGRLTNAFRQQNRDSILYYAADLGHYIGDAHVPLHTTVNYDGQLTGQKGLHSLWESLVPELELVNYNLYSGHRAQYLKAPERAVWKALRGAYSLLPDVFLKEMEASTIMPDSVKYRRQMRNGKEVRSYSSTFAKEYSKRLGNMVNEQLLKSANLIADFYYTCWIDGGKPDLNKIMIEGFNRQAEQKMKKEYKIYRKNELLKNKLLIARETRDDD